MGRKSRRTWRGLVFLGRVQFWVALTLLAGLVLSWTYLGSMRIVRGLVAALLSKGVLSAGWYSILTGLALVVLALALASVSRDDHAAGVVALASGLAGAWQLERGLRSEFQRRPRPSDDHS